MALTQEPGIGLAGELASKGGPTYHNVVPIADLIYCATRLKDGVASQYGATAFCGGRFRLNNCFWQGNHVTFSGQNNVCFLDLVV